SKKVPPKSPPSFTVRCSGSRLMPSGAWGLANLSEYQRRICELELEISRLRGEKDDYFCKAAELEAARNYYAECFAGAPVGFVTLDDMGKVLECNDTFL